MFSWGQPDSFQVRRKSVMVWLRPAAPWLVLPRRPVARRAAGYRASMHRSSASVRPSARQPPGWLRPRAAYDLARKSTSRRVIRSPRARQKSPDGGQLFRPRSFISLVKFRTGGFYLRYYPRSWRPGRLAVAVLGGATVAVEPPLGELAQLC
jgi:hypothetical protein